MNYLKTLGAALMGRPMAVVPTSGFNAATNGRRMLHVGTSDRGVSSLALSDGALLTARARKAVMDNPLAATGVTAFIAETIGTGIRPHPRHSDPVIRRNLEKEFARWTSQSSAARRIGPDGAPDSLQDFYAQQQLVARNTIVAGEAFARLRPRLASDLSPGGLRVPLQIDLIEPEQLAYWRTSGEMASPTNLVRGSIEFDAIHQRVAYHFYREHPGDSTIWPNSFEVVRVPAQSVLHVMEFVAGNQIRGITPLAPILLALSELNDYEDSERFRQKLGSHLFAWKKTLTPDDLGLNMTATAGTDIAPEATNYVESQPGSVTVIDTNAGEEMGFYAPPGTPNAYDVFMRGQKQGLSAQMRITYDMLTGDNSSTTFMNARVRLNSVRRIWSQYQTSVIVHQFCRPVWRAWLDAAALAGVIDAADYRKNPEEYLAVDWRPQAWDWIDPVKDVDSKRMAIEACLTSRSAVIQEGGEDPEDVDAAIAADHDRETLLGISPVYGASTARIEEPAGDNPANAVPAKTNGGQP